MSDSRTRDGDDVPTQIFDPESLRDCDGVRFDRETERVDRERFESVRERSEHSDGVAFVGITDDERVLLKNTCTGWAAPGGGVDPGEDWTAVARQEAKSWTGAAVEIDDVIRVHRVDFYPEDETPTSEGDDEAESSGDHETPESEGPVPFYGVYFRASPAAGETVDTETDDPELGWFEDAPEGIDPDWADEIRTFFD